MLDLHGFDERIRQRLIRQAGLAPALQPGGQVAFRQPVCRQRQAPLRMVCRAQRMKMPDRARQNAVGEFLALQQPVDQFGPLAKTVLESWGVRRCTDFGDIVFNLIEYNIFSKTDNDRREDFADIYDFDEAFVKPFRPADKHRSGPSTHAVESA